METNEQDIKQYTVAGAGGTMVCQPARLSWLKTEWHHMTQHGGWSVNDRRLLAEDTRYCRWPGQSTDGKKHSDADAGKPAFPFEGASDVRMRTADEITNEQVILLMAAVSRMQLKVTTPNPEKQKLGEQLAILWEWVKNNQLRREYIVELRKLAQFRQGDSPGIGFMQVYWKQEYSTQETEVTAEEVEEKMLAAIQNPALGMEPAEIETLLTDPARQEDLQAMLLALWPELTANQASQAAEELLGEGRASFAYPHLKENRLAWRALRLMEDVFVPENTMEEQRARMIWFRDWYSVTELREMERQGKFKPGFVDEVLKHEGESAWRHYTHYHINGDYSNRIIERTWDKNRHRGQYELLTAVFKTSNAKGVPGIYQVVYHHSVEMPGTDLELMAYKHGQYPLVSSPREILTGKLWDTRGVAELTMTEQQGLKMLHDSFLDHAQLSTVPPIKVPASRPKMALVIGPLKQIKENRPGEIAWMSPPAYPQTNDKMQEKIEARLNRYFGRQAATNMPDMVRAYQQDLFEMFLLDVREMVRMGLKLCQQYMDDATLQRILGPDALPIARSIEDIQGEFDIEISFEAGMLSLDYVKTMAELITNYAQPWDKQNQIRSEELEQWFFSSLSPTLARRLLRPVNEANQAEVEAAQKDFGKIKDGVEPDRPTQGVDFQRRLDTILGIGRMNPEAFATLTPASRQILQDHIQYLQGQIMQQQNAVIGREMAPRTLPLKGSPAGAGQN